MENNVKDSNKLLEAALFFHERYGLIVAPFKISKDENGKSRKRPLIAKGQLEQWLKDGQSIEEIKKLRWEESNGVGIFLGKTVDNLYLCCIDIDAKEVFWRPLLRYLPVTRFERTPRDGLHAFYFSEEKPRPVSISISDKERIELLFNKWVVIHPSEGYSKLNDSSIRVVEDVYRIFMDFIFDCGFDECIPKNNEDINVNEKGGAGALTKYLQMVEDFLQPYLAYSGHGYRLYRCVFHPPDNHPSLLLNLRKGYVHDFHINESYSLKSFLLKVGALTAGEKREKSQEPSKFDVKRFADALKNVGCIEYIVNPLLPKGALILLVGRPGEGKSFLTLDFSLKIAKGEKILESFESQKYNVLLCDFENSLSLLKERAAFITDEIPENLFLLTDAIYLDDKANVATLEKIIVENNISVVVFDNFSCMFKSTKENDNLQIYRLLRRLRDICRKHNVTAVIIHHTRKTQPFTASLLDEVRGSSSIVALSDIVLLLEKIQDFFRLRILKNRVSNVFESYILELVKGGFRLLQKGAELSGDRLSAVCRYIESVATSMPNGVFAVKNISQSSPFSSKEIYQALQFLQGIGKIKRLKRGLYQYVLQTLLTANEDIDTAE
jgi:KaiC/GvpD/RAD55 family RecA-like ATPase